jgi:hypothetical protein
VSKPHRNSVSRNLFAGRLALAAMAVMSASSAWAAPPSAAPPMAQPASTPQPQPQPQGSFGFFFGSWQRPSAPPSASAYAPEVPDTRPPDVAPRSEPGSPVAYCVRLCDGHFFPVPRGNASAVETCNSFCPATKTKIFSGGSIDHSVARDGSRYGDLATAFLYRTKIVPGCTCNGRDAFGLATVKPTEDATLRAGDVVTTETGFMSYRGGGKQGANFTPVEQASGTSAELRRQLSQTKIAPADPSEPAPLAVAPAGRDGNDRQVQLSK